MTGFAMFRGGRHLAAALLVAAVVGGCATQPVAPELQSTTSNTTGDESDARNRARIHTELAAGYFDLGNIGVALEEINIALQADAGYHTAYSIAGLIYAALKEDRRAEESFNRAIRLSPTDPDANHNYGGFLCQRKRELEGIKYLLIAVQNPLYATPDRSLVAAGSCARSRGDDAAAQVFFQRAITLRPTQPQALYQLAELAFAARNYAAAQGYLRRFGDVAVPGANALWLAIRVERRLGNALGEASFTQQLRKNFPDSPEAAALQAGRFE